jgi:DNA-binding transcriptional MocR family regulator
VHSTKATVFTDALRERTSDRLRFSVPRGGFFVWAQLKDRTLSIDRLIAAAAEQQLLLTAGRHFAADGGSQWDRHIRFAFSAPTVDELPIAVDRLVAAFDSAN